MLHFTQHDKSESVIPSQSEESSAMWMLRCAQHDGVNSKPHPVCFADRPSPSRRRGTFRQTPKQGEVVDASLRSAGQGEAQSRQARPCPLTLTSPCLSETLVRLASPSDIAPA